MKKIFLFALAAATMAVGCQKFQDILKPSIDTNEDEYAAYPVTFGTNVATVSTKAAVDNVSGLAQDSIFVYGVNNDDLTLLVENYKITTPLAAKNTIENIYYGANKETYSFYGYYAGNQVTSPKYSDGIITVPVAITGQEDLMIGLTDKANDLTNRENKGDAPNVNELYSAKSARRGVTPNLVFEHKLVRFDFVFEDGATWPQENTNSVWVEKIDVPSAAEGQLVINHANNTGVLEFTPEETKTLSLGSLKPAENAEDWKPLVKFGAGAAALTNGTIMVMPASSYDVALYLNQTGAKEVAKQNLTLEMPTGMSFEAGKKYEVKIRVYGMEAVLVDVTVKEWAEGGSFEYDPDQDEKPVYYPALGDTVNFTADGGTQTFKIASGTTIVNPDTEGAGSWLVVKVEGDKVTFTAASNDTEAERTVDVLVNSTETLTVTQSAE